MRRLLDYCSISKNVVSKFEGKKKYVATGDIIENEIKSFEKVTFDNRPSRAKQIGKNGDVIFAKMKDTVKVLKISDENEENIYSTGFFVLSPTEKINSNYLFWLLNSKKFNYEKDKRCHGATQKALNNEDLGKILIKDIPDIEQQINISDILEKTDNIIKDRKKQINELHELVKSQFVEMFGNLSENTMHWKEYDINKIVKGNLNNGYFAKRNEYVENGNVEIIGVASVVNRMFSNIDNLPMTNANKQDIEKYRVRYGDLLFCRSSLVAEGIGKASIVPKNVKSNQLFECHVIRMHLNLNECVPEYIQKLTEDNYFRKQLMKGAKTATMTTIGQNDILKCKVLLPPIELQNKFASFVEQIDKQEFEELKSEKLLKNLIDEGAKNVKF